MKSETNSSFGRAALQFRCTRSGARSEVRSGRVVTVLRVWVAPRMPSSRNETSDAVVVHDQVVLPAKSGFDLASPVDAVVRFEELGDERLEGFVGELAGGERPGERGPHRGDVTSRIRLIWVTPKWRWATTNAAISLIAVELGPEKCRGLQDLNGADELTILLADRGELSAQDERRISRNTFTRPRRRPA